MSVIAARRCVQHPGREAIARCPSCAQFFCRECVVEHDGQLLCAACLAKESAPAAARRSPVAWARLGELAVTACCVLLLWIVFYGIGQFLQVIPADVHEGTIWRIAP